LVSSLNDAPTSGNCDHFGDDPKGKFLRRSPAKVKTNRSTDATDFRLTEPLLD